MKINNDCEIIKKADDTIFFVEKGTMTVIRTNDPVYNDWVKVYETLRATSLDRRNEVYVNMTLPVTDVKAEDNKVEVEELSDDEKVTRGLTNIINFFSEFQFEPNYRFINTLAYAKSGKNYIKSYFELSNNQYLNEVVEKMKSKEFKNILSDIKVAKPTSHINKRLKIYYGSAGTGKTTLAQKESDNRCIVCNASMLPADLMEDFVFVDGKPSFKPSVLWDCMTNGKPIVLDEINLLPFDSLRFLQGILDGKSEFDYKGHKVTIAEGFEVIGTMNLSIGGMVFGLPEPLIDRCYEMKKFTLDASMLKSALV